MSISVHIEHLLLEGLPVTAANGPVVQAALEAELTRRLEEHGLAVSSSCATPRLSLGSLQLSQSHDPGQLGEQIAAAIHGGLAPATASSRLREGSGR